MRQLTMGVVLGVLVVCGTVQAQDIGWPPAPVGETGQVTCSDGDGNPVDPCDGSGHDGDLRPGMAWPNPRFTGPGDGTVRDNLTGLVWLENADCSIFFGGDGTGQNDRTWSLSFAAAAALSHGYCGLLDSSVPGDWRLPSRFELESLLDLEYWIPSLSDAAGTAQWATDGDAFSAVQSTNYWSSSSRAGYPTDAWVVNLYNAWVTSVPKTDTHSVWPVRDGAPVFADGFGPGDAQKWSGEVP